MDLKRAGLLVALAALLVNGPRLVLIYLRVDGLALPAQVEGAMLALTGIATGIVLTGGGMYIAHVLARPAGTGGFARALLGLCWVLLLAFAVVLISPALVAGIRATDMAGVLNTARWQWVWAVTAVEVLAVGAMVAHSLAGEPAQARSKRRASKPGALGLLADAAARRLVAGIERRSERAEDPRPEHAGGPHPEHTERPAERAEPEAARKAARSDGTAGSLACPQAAVGCDYVGTQAGVNAHALLRVSAERPAQRAAAGWDGSALHVVVTTTCAGHLAPPGSEQRNSAMSSYSGPYGGRLCRGMNA